MGLLCFYLLFLNLHILINNGLYIVKLLSRRKVYEYLMQVRHLGHRFLHLDVQLKLFNFHFTFLKHDA